MALTTLRETGLKTEFDTLDKKISEQVSALLWGGGGGGRTGRSRTGNNSTNYADLNCPLSLVADRASTLQTHLSRDGAKRRPY